MNMRYTCISWHSTSIKVLNMHFSINNASGRPAYQQIIDQVKRDIALGGLVKDEKLIELLYYNDKGLEK